MKRKYEQYSSTFKQKVLEKYCPGIIGRGFKSLAKRFKIQGGHKLIMYWYRSWDGNVRSLDHRKKGSRRPCLSNEEVKRHILNSVVSANTAGKSIRYEMVQKDVQKCLNREISLRTIQRYGKEKCGIRSKTTRELTDRDGE